MALKFSTAVKNARLNATETAIGASAILKLFTGAPPAAVSDAVTGTVLATMALPSDYMADAANGQKLKSGTWSDASADAGGTAGWFGIFASDGTTRHVQGTVTLTGGGGDLTLDNTSIVAGQQVDITGFQLNAAN